MARELDCAGERDRMNELTHRITQPAFSDD